MANQQGTAQWILIIFVATTLAAYQFAPAIIKWSKTAGLIESMIVYVIVNPIYIGIFSYLSSKYKVRGFLASFFIVAALDIQSLPHVVDGDASPDALTYLFLDSILWRHLGSWMGLFGLYVILPITLVIIAYELVAPSFFVGSFKRFSG